MSRRESLITGIVAALVMTGVVFGILTNSRNSILIKEIVYVAGASLSALAGAVFLIAGKPAAFRRIPLPSLAALAGVMVLGAVTHFTGISSVNGPFTLSMLLSISVLAVVMLLYMKIEHMDLLLLLLVVYSSVIFIYSILQWQGVNIFLWDAALTRSGRSTGTLGNPNLLGGFASAMVPPGVCAILMLKKLKAAIRKVLAAVFGGLSVAAVIASGTRGSILGLSAGCMVLLIWYIRRERPGTGKLIPLIITFVAVIAAVTLPMSTRLSELDPSQQEQGTLQVRKLIWSGAMALFRESPVTGHGPGSFQILYPEHRSPWYSLLGVSHNTLHAHCEYLEILVDTGIAGLLLWGCVLFFALRRARGMSPVQAGALAGLAGMLAEALVSVHLRWPPTAWLFGFLFTVYLAGEEEPLSHDKLRIPSAAALLVCSGLLGFSFFSNYLPAAEASRYVFLGKDIYLNRTESAMQNAYAASAQWGSTGNENALQATVNSWNAARVFADSAVHFSMLGTETYPWDLGGWYALGSARLTRQMVMNPPVSGVSAALEYAGDQYICSEAMSEAELMAGMEAYRRLLEMAPNYAEVHNNLALGYSSMGRLEPALDELYASYRLHGHRREDYLAQTKSLLPLCPGSISGRLVLFYSLMEPLACPDSSVRTDAILRIVSIHAGAASLEESLDRETCLNGFRDLAAELVPDETAERVNRALEQGLVYPTAGGDGTLTPEEFEQYAGEIQDMALFMECFPGVYPDSPEYYTAPVPLFLSSGMEPEGFQRILNVYLHQMIMDRTLDNAWTLAVSNRFHSNVDPEVLQGLESVRSAVGGTRTALREGLSTPWTSGSLPWLLTDTLRGLQLSDSLNPVWYEMELELDFLVLSSYWWDQQIFSWTQNQYLLESVFRCRDSLRALAPDSWQSRVQAIVRRNGERVDPFSRDTSGSPLELLETDLVSGAARAPADQPSN